MVPLVQSSKVNTMIIILIINIYYRGKVQNYIAGLVVQYYEVVVSLTREKVLFSNPSFGLPCFSDKQTKGVCLAGAKENRF